MWEVPMETKQPSALINNIMSQKSEPELAQYLHAALLIPTTEILANVIKQGLLKTWQGLTKKLINRHTEKASNTTMGHLLMRRQGL